MQPSSGEDKPSGDPSALQHRKEGFLARYPRKLKIAVFFIILLLLVSPLFIKGHEQMKMAEKKSERLPNEARGEDTEAAIPNPGPETVNTPASKTGGSGGPEILNDQDDHSIKMAAAPDPGLSEDTSQGSLPRISEDGRQPWQVYARPFNTADKRPRIAIVITDLGLSRVTTDAAISRMPANVTLAFSVQSPVVGAWGARARQDGHETLLQIPMEPFDYPRSDPGPNTLLTTLPNADNLARLLWALRQSSGYVGITTLSGSRFTTDPTKLTPVLDILRQRGLMIFDARVAPHSAIMDLSNNMHTPAVAETVRIDQNLTPEAIDTSLNQLEQTARLTGHAVGIAAPTPLVLDRLQVWFKDLPQRGIALAPISSMVQ